MRRAALLAAMLIALPVDAQLMQGAALSGTHLGFTGTPALSVLVVVGDDFGTTSDERYGSTDPDVSLTMPALDTLDSTGSRFTKGLIAGKACAVSRAMLYSGIYNDDVGLYTATDYDNWVYGTDNALGTMMTSAGAVAAITGKLPFSGGFEALHAGWGPGIDGWTMWSGWDEISPPDYGLWTRYYGDADLYAADPEGDDPQLSEPRTDYVDDASFAQMVTWYAARNRTKRFIGIVNPYNPHLAIHDPTGPPPWDGASCSPLSNDQCLQLMATRLDSGVQTLIDAASGDNTIIIFTSDNGANKANEKTTINEAGLVVPLYAYGATVPAGGITVRATVSDLYMTLIDLAGQTAYAGSAPLRGYSFATLLGQPCGFVGRCWSDRTGAYMVAGTATGNRSVYDTLNYPNYKLTVNYATGATAFRDISAYNPGDGTEPTDLCGGDGDCTAAELDASAETAYAALCVIYASWESGETACDAL